MVICNLCILKEIMKQAWSRVVWSLQPYKHMIDGIRMDVIKSWYANFDKLYLYCYNMTNTIGFDECAYHNHIEDKTLGCL